MNDLNNLQDSLGYKFKNKDLLCQALRHRSSGDYNNERLEFLGDSILGAIVTDNIYKKYPGYREGDLSRMRAMLVNGRTLSDMAVALTVNQYITLGSGENQDGYEYRESILADAMEAVIGAIYLDSDYDRSRSIVWSWFGEYVGDSESLSPIKDPKTKLQEWCQANKYDLPDYTSKIAGPDHKQVFVVVCRIDGMEYSSSAQGSSRKKAEQKAAQNYLEWLYDR